MPTKPEPGPVLAQGAILPSPLRFIAMTPWRVSIINSQVHVGPFDASFPYMEETD